MQNTSDAVVKYDALGTWVEGTDIFQKSYARHSSGDDPLVINPAGTDWSRIKHDDKLSIPNPGTYNLYLAIHFVDNGNITAALLAGPVTITVQ